MALICVLVGNHIDTTDTLDPEPTSVSDYNRLATGQRGSNVSHFGIVMCYMTGRTTVGYPDVLTEIIILCNKCTMLFLPAEVFPTLFLLALTRKVFNSPGGAKFAISTQSSTEVLLSSGGADGLCGSGDAGAGCDDVRGYMLPNARL